MPISPEMVGMAENEAKNIIIAVISIALAIACCCLAYIGWEKKKAEKPTVISQEEVKQPETVAKEIHVSEPAAQTIVREIEKSSGSTPSVTYYVTAPTVEKAAENTAKQMENKDKSLPAKALEKSDRTIVTPDEKLNKVDVYKINLRKAHKVKAGVSCVYDKSYFTAGYQAGRWEGLAYFDWNGRPKGGSVLYTAFEW
jgi:type IV secretory pathway VirB10-like protein